MEKKFLKINEILSLSSNNKQSFSFYALIQDSTYPFSNRKRCQSVLNIIDETTNNINYELFIVADEKQSLPIVSKIGDIIKVINAIKVIFNSH